MEIANDLHSFEKKRLTFSFLKRGQCSKVNPKCDASSEIEAFLSLPKRFREVEHCDLRVTSELK